MFRTISLLGAAVACLIVALIAILFDARIASDESWNVENVMFYTFLAIAVLTFVGIYIGRRREVGQQSANSAEVSRMQTPR